MGSSSHAPPGGRCALPRMPADPVPGPPAGAPGPVRTISWDRSSQGLPGQGRVRARVCAAQCVLGSGQPLSPGLPFFLWEQGIAHLSGKLGCHSARGLVGVHVPSLPRRCSDLPSEAPGALVPCGDAWLVSEHMPRQAASSAACSQALPFPVNCNVLWGLKSLRTCVHSLRQCVAHTCPVPSALSHAAQHLQRCFRSPGPRGKKRRDLSSR